ncbi:hypothetical protein AFCDBAGC_5116 [Methylobacterium cerastii]|uniref:Uncharacterized protein n=1 Tax=Methylobacterium cerastii TaxID=932741 RepID=A0ABQ4QR89_9HYPH|nr:hypothetical protein AFCDBAGC_5116 [Methylobacterium cerastii]
MADLAAGSLGFRLYGEKLTGAWKLVRMKARPKERRASWLLIIRERQHDLTAA